MAHHLIYVNQQWVGDHTEEWFAGAERKPGRWRADEGRRRVRVRRRPGGGGAVCSADPTSGTTLVTDGQNAETTELLGGFALVDVADEEAAGMWAGRVAEACGRPHEVRRLTA